MTARTVRHLLAAALLVAACGCGGGPNLVTARGKLTHKGQPVPSTYVTFQPQEEGKRASTGLTDDDWWAAQAPLLEEVLDPDRFPVAGRVGTAAAEAYRGLWDPDHAFEFGLQRVLDGIEVLVESRSKSSS